MNQNNKKNKMNLSPKFSEIDFGTRKITSQNFSRLVAIPKTALSNCGLQDDSFVNVKLVQINDEKYIKLTPIRDREHKES